MACTDMYMAGTLNVSKKICAACSRFELGLSAASVRRTGCCRAGRGVSGERGRGRGRRGTRGTTHLFRQRAQLLAVHVGPYPLHVVPVGHDSVLHRVAAGGRAGASARQRSVLRPARVIALVQLSNGYQSTQESGRERSETYLMRSRPLSSCAFLPTNVSPSTAPAMTRVCFGRPVHRMPSQLLSLQSRKSRGEGGRADAPT